MICDYFWVTGAHDTFLDYADLFYTTRRNDDVQECDTRLDEILLTMTKIPPIKSWKKMVVRSIDHKLRFRDFDARNERIETMAVVKSRKESRGVLKEDIRCGGTRFGNSVVTILRM